MHRRRPPPPPPQVRSASASFSRREYLSDVPPTSPRVGVFGHGTDYRMPDDVGRELSRIARVVRTDAVQDPRTCMLRGFTFFDFESLDDARRVVRAFEGTGLVVRGIRMRVDFARTVPTRKILVTGTSCIPDLPPAVRCLTPPPSTARTDVRPPYSPPRTVFDLIHVPTLERPRRFSFESV